MVSFNLIFAQNDEYVYKTEFDKDDDVWSIGDKEDYKAEIKDGHYYLETKAEKGSRYFYPKFKDINLRKDFQIFTSVKPSKDCDLKAFCGIIIGAKDIKNMHIFYLSFEGYWSISRFDNDSLIEIVKWKKDKNVTPFAKNMLSVKCLSDKWYFYVNGEEVHTMDAQKIYGKKFGLFVRKNSKIEVDYFSIKQEKDKLPAVDISKINLIADADKFGERVNLGSNVNTTKYDEKSPVISASGKSLFFTREDDPQNTEGIKSDIWRSKINPVDSSWGEAKNVGRPWNNKGFNSLVCLSTDNNTALLGNIYTELGEPKGEGGLSISFKKEKTWTIPKKMEIKNYYNDDDYYGFSLSPDGKVLICSIQRDDTYGDSDFYVCFLQSDSTWTEPKNIGRALNTVGGESTAFIAADGKTLYFSSDGHPGYGKKDIFMSRRLDDTWLNWSTPQNLGSKVNSANSDAKFSVPASGEYAYLISYDKATEWDIYKIKVPESAKPFPTVLVQGIVYNKENQMPMSATITYYELGSDKILGRANSDPETGQFQLALVQGKKYSFNAECENFISEHYNFDAINLKSYKEHIADMYLSPIKKGATIVMNNLFFVANKFDILPESYPELDMLYLMLKENPSVKIEIAGHTSINTSGEKFNKELSNNRAAEVKKYLIGKGISAGRISSVGYGYSKPLFTGNEEAIQAKNRRVEFTIISK
ncbi:MAG: OmpA family protein [Bacteroidota bacterium]|nr:OmpA family protein [Bacteroidota bacterium]